MPFDRRFLNRLLALALLLIPSCSAVAPEVKRERDDAAHAGEHYRVPFEQRELPPLASDAAYGELLDRALRTDPELEAAYFAWAGGVERAVVAGALPQPEFGLGWMITEPPTWMLQNVLLAAKQMLPAGAKLDAMQQEALAEARAARARFESLWFGRKGRFHGAYAGLDRAAREVEFAEREVALLVQLASSTNQRVASGAARANDALALVVEIEQARDRALGARAELRAAAARVNAMLSREPFAALAAPPPLVPATLDRTDEELLTLATQRNAELREATAMVAARQRGVDVAQAGGSVDLDLEYRREMTDNMLMLGFTLPLRREQIRAGIAAAEDALREQQARERGARNDARSGTAESIVRLRESERRLALFRDRILPIAEHASDALALRYAADDADFADWVESRRALLELDRTVVAARTDREVAVAELLVCCALELEDLR
jgi:outer membrane protein TolC